MDPEFDITTPTSGVVSRRRFLAGSTLAGGLAVFTVACGSDKKNTAGQTATTAAGTPTTAAGANADLETAAVAASLEKLAVDTYTSAGEAATAGKLGTVPPAVVSSAAWCWAAAVVTKVTDQRRRFPAPVHPALRRSPTCPGPRPSPCGWSSSPAEPGLTRHPA